MAGCDRGRRMLDSLCGGPKTPRGLPKPATDQFTGLHLARAIATAAEPSIQTFPGSAARGSGALQLWETWPRERGPKTAARVIRGTGHSGMRTPSNLRRPPFYERAEIHQGVNSCFQLLSLL
jgi:hypothetical protein